MIDIPTLTEKDVGREVVYHSTGITEYGYLKSWNDSYLFVVYGQASMGRGSATRPQDCTFTDCSAARRGIQSEHGE